LFGSDKEWLLSDQGVQWVGEIAGLQDGAKIMHGLNPHAELLKMLQGKKVHLAIADNGMLHSLAPDMFDEKVVPKINQLVESGEIEDWSSWQLVQNIIEQEGWYDELPE
jgi:hypothetical protein